MRILNLHCRIWGRTGGGDLGLRIVRFRNEDVIKDTPSVVGRIKSHIPILGEALSSPLSSEHINKLRGSLKGTGAMKALMEERRKESQM